jgi:hypothetical protein
MAKSSAVRSLVQVGKRPMSKAEVMNEVRLHVEEAAMLLRSLGRDYEKAAWLLEDSLQIGTSETERVEQSVDWSVDRGRDRSAVDWASLIQAEELIYS